MKPKGLVLFHGAGGNKDQRVFTQIEERLQIPVVRKNFAYRDKGKRHPPPRVDKLVDEIKEECILVAKEMGISTSGLLVGGRSMGGRAASIAVASGLAARGLVLLSYPLHPIKKPDNLRVEHFPSIKRPCLFVSGDRDPFGSPEEFKQSLTLIKAPITLEWLVGENHNPKDLDQIVEKLENWIRILR